MSGKKLPSRILQVLLILSDHIVPIPAEIHITDRKDEMTRGLERFIWELPLFMRAGLIWAIRFFNLLPVFFGYGLKTFVHLTEENRELYIKTWAESRMVHKREIFKAIRGLIAVVALSDKRYWDYLGYQPEEHLRGKIKLRESILHETGAINHNQ